MDVKETKLQKIHREVELLEREKARLEEKAQIAEKKSNIKEAEKLRKKQAKVQEELEENLANWAKKKLEEERKTGANFPKPIKLVLFFFGMYLVGIGAFDLKPNLSVISKILFTIIGFAIMIFATMFS